MRRAVGATSLLLLVALSINASFSFVTRVVLQSSKKYWIRFSIISYYTNMIVKKEAVLQMSNKIYT